MRKLIVVAGVASLAALTACGGSPEHPPGPPPPPFDRPTVSLRDVRLNGVGITGGSVDVVLGVYNPNYYGLHAPRVSYRVMVEDDIELAKGVYDADIGVAGEDSVVVRVPASFSYLSLGRAGRAVLNTGVVNYRVLGDITVGTPYGRFTFPYDRAGLFASLRPPLPR